MFFERTTARPRAARERSRALDFSSASLCLLAAACGSSNGPTHDNAVLALPGSAGNAPVIGAVGGSAGSVIGSAGRPGSSPVSTAGTRSGGAGTSGAAGVTARGLAGSGAVVGVAGAGTGVTAPIAGASGAPAPARGGANTAPGFVNVAPALGEPLDGKGSPSTPAAPSGWIWYQIDGAICRDGSPTGFYVRMGTADKLLIYLEGGGACTSPGFCSYNPANVNEVLNGDGQTVAGSIGGAVSGHQQPGTDGIFNISQAANPFKDWSQIYIPYCTGDVHFGTRKNVMLPGVDAPQQFVGYLNMQKFMARIVPSFRATTSRVVLTGASAGGFGALLNYSMVQDAFGSVLVTVLDDSGPSFGDNPQYMPVCMEKNWREIWGFKDSFPSDCTECMQADGGGLNQYAKYLFRKHPNATVGLVSSMEDEVIRLFYSSGLQNCGTFATADPTTITLGQVDPTVYMPGADYTAGLNELRMTYAGTGKFATYYLGGANLTFHQHIWRDRFYDASAGKETIAQWATNLLAGKLEQIGP